MKIKLNILLENGDEYPPGFLSHGLDINNKFSIKVNEYEINNLKLFAEEFTPRLNNNSEITLKFSK